MLPLILVSLTLISSSLSSPTPLAPPTPLNLPTSKSFTLLVHVPNPALDLTPSISHATLNPIHVGAGLNMLYLSPQDPTSPPPPQTPLILNSSLSSIYAPFPQFPLGWVVPGLPGDHIVFLNIGTGTPGVGFTEKNGYPRLTGPGTDMGTYVACAHDVPFPPYREVVAKFLFEGEEKQDGCVGIEFLPGCASPGEGGGGEEVECFVDLGGF